jgi:hypothetical protein
MLCRGEAVAPAVLLIGSAATASKLINRNAVAIASPLQSAHALLQSAAEKIRVKGTPHGHILSDSMASLSQIL